jgi:hypothetical protein
LKSRRLRRRSCIRRRNIACDVGISRLLPSVRCVGVSDGVGHCLRSPKDMAANAAGHGGDRQARLASWTELDRQIGVAAERAHRWA